MAYLLPIQYTQYQEYHNRMKGVKSNLNRTVRVNRVKRVYLSQVKNTRMIAGVKPIKGKEKGRDTVYAEFTGVGGNFDESI